ncbi:MAG: hypothetical protein KC535_01875 [Nanoarchaeota archaeon]|nr:hypothetical protein [Nanoarchaeota archaeon]
MRWSKKEVIYQVFVDRFSPADSSKAKKPIYAGGTLKGITQHLNYFLDLGVSALWLTPIYQGVAYHGYHITDFMKIDPHFGTLEDLKELIKTFHQYDIKVMLDFVPNHISSGHPFFQEALHKKTKAFRQWFLFSGQEEYQTFFHFKELPKLNLDNPATKEYIIDAALYWLSLGIDGFRLDHAIGPSIQFWKSFRKEIKKHHPHCILIGEVWAEHLPLKDLRTTRTKHQLFRWLAKANNDTFVKDYQEVLDGCLDFTFNRLLREHILDKKDKEWFARRVVKHYSSFNKSFLLPVFLDNHDMDRFYYSCTHKEEYKQAVKLLFSQQQPVVIYYGDESGMSQEKSMHEFSEHGDLQARQPMNWENMDSELIDYFKELIEKKVKKKSSS